MTAEIISLEEKRQEQEDHIAGEAKCQQCHHTWVAVAVVGTHILECPECKAGKGFFKSSVIRGTKYWECNCGCDVFRISPDDGVYCVNCATLATGWFK